MPVLHFASFEVITFRRKAPFELTAAYADEKMLPQGTPKAWPVGPGVKFQSGMQQSIVSTVMIAMVIDQKHLRTITVSY